MTSRKIASVKAQDLGRKEHALLGSSANPTTTATCDGQSAGNSLARSQVWGPRSSCRLVAHSAKVGKTQPDARPRIIDVHHHLMPPKYVSAKKR